MKKSVVSLVLVLLVGGCANVPKEPEAHASKYAVQILAAEVLEGAFEAVSSADSVNGAQLTPLTLGEHGGIDALLGHSDTRVDHFPVVYVGESEQGKADKTKTMMLPENYSIVDGKAVPKEKECKIGKSVSVTIVEADQDNVTYALNAVKNRLKGYDEYDAGEGIKVKMPFFETRSVNTTLTQKYHSWTLLGGLVDEDEKGETTHLIICVRVIPPVGDE